MDCVYWLTRQKWPIYLLKNVIAWFSRFHVSRKILKSVNCERHAYRDMQKPKVVFRKWWSLSRILHFSRKNPGKNRPALLKRLVSCSQSEGLADKYMTDLTEDNKMIIFDIRRQRYHSLSHACSMLLAKLTLKVSVISLRPMWSSYTTELGPRKTRQIVISSVPQEHTVLFFIPKFLFKPHLTS